MNKFNWDCCSCWGCRRYGK